ncbi:MAG: ABC transporter ATP-binding protein, partial [Candidatus Hydrogenedentes bacterium]|nr:ABC transporter ATP-binding protein [Candidatus Hydrogenedentota bacterium]
RALLASIPATRQKGAALYTIRGAPPDLTQAIAGCAFAPRCEHAAPECRAGAMSLRETALGHSTACARVVSGAIA